MNPKTNQSFFTTSAVLLISKGMERAGFYGLRSIIILHLIGEIINMERQDAIELVGILTAVVTVSMIIGGLLGDLVLTNRISVQLSNVLQILGTLICCLPNDIAIYVGLLLVGLGAGMYSGNLFALFGQLYHKKNDSMDSGFTVYNIINNVGASIGILISTSLYELHYLLGILSAVLLFIGSLLLIRSANSKNTELEVSTLLPSTGPTKVAGVLFLFFLSAFFWWAYNFGTEDTFEVTNRVATVVPEFLSANILFSLNSILTVLCGIIAAVLWKYYQITRPIKIGLGFLAASFSFLLLYSMNNSESNILFVYIIGMALFAIAETLVVPSLHSLIVRYSNPKYLAITISLYNLPYRLMAYLTGIFLYSVWDNSSYGLLIGMFTFFVIGVLVLMFRHNFIKVNNPNIASEIDEIGVKNTNS